MVLTFEQFVVTADEIKKEIKDFQRHNINIPRKQMPQIKNIHFKKFLQWMDKHDDINYMIFNIRAKQLNATQSNLNDEIVKSILEKGNLDDRPVLVTSDNYVLDGHHRVLVARVKNAKIKVLQLDKSIKHALKAVGRFPGVQYYKDA